MSARTRTSRVRVADVLTRHGGREFGVLNLRIMFKKFSIY